MTYATTPATRAQASLLLGPLPALLGFFQRVGKVPKLLRQLRQLLLVPPRLVLLQHRSQPQAQFVKWHRLRLLGPLLLFRLDYDLLGNFRGDLLAGLGPVDGSLPRL